MPPGTGPKPVTSDQGWSYLTRTFSHSIPRKLKGSSLARQSLRHLTKNRGH